MKCVRTTTDDERMQPLIKLLDIELKLNYGSLQDTYDTFNVFERACNAILILVEGNAIACGAFKQLEGKVELKRMFVLPNYRGEKVAQKVLTELENWAKELGFENAILETGKLQFAAIAFYQKNGFVKIDCYPPYDEISESICFGKRLH